MIFEYILAVNKTRRILPKAARRVHHSKSSPGHACPIADGTHSKEGRTDVNGQKELGPHMGRFDANSESRVGTSLASSCDAATACSCFIIHDFSAARPAFRDPRFIVAARVRQ